MSVWREVRVVHHGDGLEAGNQFFQKLCPLARNGRVHVREARDVAAGMAEALHDLCGYGISYVHEQDGHRACKRSQRVGCQGVRGDQKIGLQREKLFGPGRSGVTIGPTVFQLHVFARPPTPIAKSAIKSCDTPAAPEVD